MSTAQLRTPPAVDPAIPLDGFSWDAPSGRYINSEGGYTFDPHDGVFLNMRTEHQYVFDADRRLFIPRDGHGRTLHEGGDAAPFTPVKELLSGGLKLSAELSNRTEALSSLLCQLTRRFTPRTESEPPDSAPAAGPFGVATPSRGPF